MGEQLFEDVREEAWAGLIPAEFSMDSSEVTSLQRPLPLYVSELNALFLLCRQKRLYKCSSLGLGGLPVYVWFGVTCSHRPVGPLAPLLWQYMICGSEVAAVDTCGRVYIDIAPSSQVQVVLKGPFYHTAVRDVCNSVQPLRLHLYTCRGRSRAAAVQQCAPECQAR